MELRILNWSYSGIRGVSNLEISVASSDNKAQPVSLIMMPNGTGKTTTMKLFRAILDGSATTWSEHDVRGLKPPDSDIRRGEFRVNMALDGKLYIVYLLFDYDTGLATYKTSRIADQGGLDRGHKLPLNAQNVFTPDFVKRFIFDGELAKDILNNKKQEAERAITYLYLLDRLDSIGVAVQRVLDAAQKNDVSSAKTSQGLTWLRTDRDQTARLLKQMEDKLDADRQQLFEKLERLEIVKEQITRRMKDDKGATERVEELTRRREQNRLLVKEKMHNVLSHLRDPYQLSPRTVSRLQWLFDNMQQLKLPKAMSSQFFEELAEHEWCVCGRRIGPVERQHILGDAKRYLGDEQIGAMNVIKSALRGRDYNDSLEEATASLRIAIEERNRLNHEWDRLAAMQIQQGDDTLETMRKDEKDLEIDIAKLQSSVDQLTTTDKGKLENLTSAQNITKCRAELELKNQRVLKATGTVNLSSQATIMRNYLEAIRQEALSRLKEEILSTTNAKIGQVIRTERVELDGIRGHLALRNKGGGSEGQSLAIAYCFLGSMFERSTYSLPFVVDSPAGALDLQVRRSVSTILPTLFKQLIVFITSGERAGFADHFYDLPGVQFLTITKRPNQDAQCISGVDFFRIFQEEERERVSGRGYA